MVALGFRFSTFNHGIFPPQRCRSVCVCGGGVKHRSKDGYGKGWPLQLYHRKGHSLLFRRGHFSALVGLCLLGLQCEITSGWKGG